MAGTMKYEFWRFTPLLDSDSNLISYLNLIAYSNMFIRFESHNIFANIQIHKSPNWNEIQKIVNLLIKKS